ncbi:MAG: SprT-like domain-containing protein [Silvanigrellaceae bacterium]
MNKTKPVIAFLEEAWLKQLYTEYESILFQYRLKLRKPLIELRDMSGQWGQWDPLTRTIVINKNLILTHDWQHVVGVLKHEMAHQFVSEILAGDAGHGVPFQRACDAVGVAEEYRGSGLDLGEPLRTWQENSVVPEEDAAILRKVEKLLAMAESSNENEAFLAMARVRELFHKYNLERLMSRKKTRYVSLVVNHKKLKIDRIQRMIASILTGYYFVDVVFSDLYDAQMNQNHKTMEILGSEQNVLMAEYIYGFLRQQSESLWSSYRGARALKGAAPKLSFQSGVIAGFRKKLERMEIDRMESAEYGVETDTEDCDEESSTALVKFNDPGLRKFVKSRFPRLTSVRSGGRVLGEHYDRGKVQGEKIIIHKGINSRKGPSGAQLGPARG